MKGTVISYERARGGGQVRLEDDRLISFSNGAFESGWPVRPPRAGDPVVVRLSESSNIPLYVRLQKPAKAAG